MNATNLPTGTHKDLSHAYGCAATITVAYFVYAGIVHQAARFCRADMPTGRIEIYTCEPGDLSIPDFLRYVDEACPTTVDAAALRAIALVPGSTLTDATSERYAALEMS